MWPLRTAKRENTMREHVSKGHRYLLMTAVVMTYLLVFAVIVFGAFAVLTGLSPSVAAIDFGAALMVLALMVVASVVAWFCPCNPMISIKISFRNPHLPG